MILYVRYQIDFAMMVNLLNGEYVRSKPQIDNVRVRCTISTKSYGTFVTLEQYHRTQTINIMKKFMVIRTTATVTILFFLFVSISLISFVNILK